MIFESVKQKNCPPTRFIKLTLKPIRLSIAKVWVQDFLWFFKTGFGLQRRTNSHTQLKRKNTLKQNKITKAKKKQAKKKEGKEKTRLFVKGFPVFSRNHWKRQNFVHVVYPFRQRKTSRTKESTKTGSVQFSEIVFDLPREATWWVSFLCHLNVLSWEQALGRIQLKPFDLYTFLLLFAM